MQAPHDPVTNIALSAARAGSNCRNENVPSVCASDTTKETSSAAAGSRVYRELRALLSSPSPSLRSQSSAVCSGCRAIDFRHVDDEFIDGVNF
jgi:hypothetical protein